MYASPNANLNGAADDTMEDFLLGKKNVDELLRAKQRQEIVSFCNITDCACYSCLFSCSKLPLLPKKKDSHFPTPTQTLNVTYKARFVKILY